MRIDPNKNVWWNPLSWSADTWGAIGSAILVGVSVVGLGALAVATGGLGGVAIMAVASGMGFGAGIGAVSAISSGTSVTVGMLSYTIDNGLNGRGLNWKDALGSGSMQALTGAVIGQTGFYNIPGQSKFLLSQWISNFAVGQFFKGLMFYPFSFTFSLLQKIILAGGCNSNEFKI